MEACELTLITTNFCMECLSKKKHLHGIPHANFAIDKLAFSIIQKTI
jgi:hypothetical protein